jgi:hypothetical protein
MPAGSAGGSMKVRNKRHRNNFIKIDGFIEYGKKLIFIVIKCILAIGKKICQRKLFVWYHVGTTPFWWIWLIVTHISILPQTSEELFYFVTKRIPYLCGFWRFANA